jgi:hypothetical protein
MDYKSGNPSFPPWWTGGNRVFFNFVFGRHPFAKSGQYLDKSGLVLHTGAGCVVPLQECVVVFVVVVVVSGWCQIPVGGVRRWASLPDEVSGRGEGKHP